MHSDVRGVLMNKKYIVGGLIFWAGVSGYMGLRILESYTEDAVFAALSAVPAQAQEIKYSFLSNTLTLKGVEYELPDDKIMHKGTIDNVEVKGFNRKCMFVKPDMPPYDPDSLPIVAESITATGIIDNVHVGQTKVEQKLEQVQLRGWYQRLGMLLDQHSQHNGEASFFEELYRCRLDGMDFRNVTTIISEPGVQPVRIEVATFELPKGIRAPKGEEKSVPVSLRIADMRVAGGDFSGAIQQLDLDELLIPEPVVMAEFLRLNRELESGDSEQMAGSTGDVLLDRMVALMAEYYEDRVPVARTVVQGGVFTMWDIAGRGKPEESSTSISLKSLDYSLSMTDEGSLKTTTALSGLKFKFPDFMGSNKIIDRYAPEGLTLNMTSDTLVGDKELSGTARYELEGLGVLEGDLDLRGDIRSFRKASAEGFSDDTLDGLMQSLRLSRLNLVYKDSGLVPMGVELSARWKFKKPEVFLQKTVAMLKILEQSPDRPVQEFCRAVEEQLSRPGEFTMIIAPKQPINFMEALSLASENPDALPVTFSSKPGTKALKDYFPGDENE